eukprot:3478589-Prymnesium_polylepis.1
MVPFASWAPATRPRSAQPRGARLARPSCRSRLARAAPRGERRQAAVGRAWPFCGAESRWRRTATSSARSEATFIEAGADGAGGSLEGSSGTTTRRALMATVGSGSKRRDEASESRVV